MTSVNLSKLTNIGTLLFIKLYLDFTSFSINVLFLQHDPTRGTMLHLAVMSPDGPLRAVPAITGDVLLDTQLRWYLPGVSAGKLLFFPFHVLVFGSKERV